MRDNERNIKKMKKESREGERQSLREIFLNE